MKGAVRVPREAGNDKGSQQFIGIHITSGLLGHYRLVECQSNGVLACLF